MAAGGPARSFGRSAGVLSAGVGAAGLLTYVFFALASHNLDATAYGEVVVLWSAIFVTISVAPPAGRAVHLAHDRRAPRARRADRRRRWRPRPGSRRWSRSASRSSALALRGPLTGRPALRQRDALLDLRRRGARLRRQLLRPRLSRRRGPLRAPRRAAHLGVVLADGVLARGRGRARRAAGTRSRPGSSPRRCSRSRSSRSPSDAARRRATPGARRRSAGRARRGLARGGAFAAAVLLIMLSEQIFLNAGPLLLRATDGAAAAGFIFNVLMLARAPLLVFQGIAISLLPHLTRLRSRGATTRRRGGVRGLGRASPCARSPPSPRVVAVVVAIAGPALMQIAFARPLRLRPRRAADRHRGDGPLPRLDDAQPGGARPGPGAPRGARCWIACAIGFLVWSLLAGRSTRRAGSRSASSPPRRCSSSPCWRALPRARRDGEALQPGSPRRSRRGSRSPTRPAENRVPSPGVRLRADPRRRPPAGRRARGGQGRRPRPGARPAALPRPRDADRLRGHRRGRVRPTPS